MEDSSVIRSVLSNVFYLLYCKHTRSVAYEYAADIEVFFYDKKYTSLAGGLPL